MTPDQWIGIGSGVAATASNLLTAKGNRKHQNKINEENRDFTREMYERTFNDNLNMWHMQNQYNNPLSQMQRFKEAGLNPNLIYGQGNTAEKIASGQMTSGNAKSSPSNFDLSSGLQAYNSFVSQSAQTDVLKEQGKVLQADANLKAIQGTKTLLESDGLRIDNNTKSQLSSISVDTAKAMLQNALKQNDVMDIDIALKTAQTHKTDSDRLVNVRQIENLEARLDLDTEMSSYYRNKIMSDIKKTSYDIKMLEQQYDRNEKMLPLDMKKALYNIQIMADDLLNGYSDRLNQSDYLYLKKAKQYREIQNMDEQSFWNLYDRMFKIVDKYTPQ